MTMSFLENIKIGDKVGATRNANYELRRSLVRFGTVARITKTLVEVHFENTDPLTFDRRTGYLFRGSPSSSFRLLQIDEANKEHEAQTKLADRNNAWTKLEQRLKEVKSKMVNNCGDVTRPLDEETRKEILEILAKI